MPAVQAQGAPSTPHARPPEPPAPPPVKPAKPHTPTSSSPAGSFQPALATAAKAHLLQHDAQSSSPSRPRHPEDDEKQRFKARMEQDDFRLALHLQSTGDAPHHEEKERGEHKESPRPKGKKQTLQFAGIHGTESEAAVPSLEAGLSYKKQMEARSKGVGDPTEASGPGFYFMPRSDVSSVGQKDNYGHKHKLAVYASGLDEQSRLDEDTDAILKQSASLDLDGDGDVQLTDLNHPTNLWARRHVDNGEEMVVRPHLYDADELSNAIKIAALTPSDYDPRSHFRRSMGEDDVWITLTEDGNAYRFRNDEHAAKFEGANMANAAIHADIDESVNGIPKNRLGVAILESIYGDLEMPASVYRLLVNVAEFDFRMQRIDGSQMQGTLEHEAAPVGASILPTREELAALIAAAREANPIQYAD